MQTVKKYIEDVKNDKELNKTSTSLRKVTDDLDKTQKELEEAKAKDYYDTQATDVINLENKVKFLKSKKEELESKYEILFKKYDTYQRSAHIKVEIENLVFEAIGEEKIKQVVKDGMNNAMQEYNKSIQELRDELTGCEGILPDSIINAMVSDTGSSVMFMYHDKLHKIRREIEQIMR